MNQGEFEGLDRSIVRPGLPAQAGLYLLWSNDNGWPLLDLLRIEHSSAGRTTFWRGSSGTDRPGEVPMLFRISYADVLGHSAASNEAVAHYERLWEQTSARVKAMLAAL